MAVLLLRLAAPLQAWGSSSKFIVRSTEREPTKSGVIGMIAAALGIQRNDDPQKLVPLTTLRFGVRADKEGVLLKDFHTVQVPGEKHPEVSYRYYLSDAVFLVALESDDKLLLESIASALQKPVYPLYLGRKSCPPTLPIVLGVKDEDILTALKTEPYLYKNAHRTRIKLDMTKTNTMKALVCPSRFHGAIESAESDGRTRKLWRIDELGGEMYLLILSEKELDFSNVSDQFGA